MKPWRKFWNKTSGRARRDGTMQSKLLIKMRDSVRGDRLQFDMDCTCAITTVVPHMLKVGGAVSLAMNAWTMSWQGGRRSNKVG